MLSVEDGLEVQMAPRRGPCCPHPGDNFVNTDRVALLDGDRLKVVVRGDKPIAVIDFNPVAATPGMPADGPDHARIGCVDPSAACCREVLAPVKFAGRAGNGAGAQPERGRCHEVFKRSHEEAERRPLQTRGCDVQFAADSILGRGLDGGPAESQERLTVRGKCRVRGKVRRVRYGIEIQRLRTRCPGRREGHAQAGRCPAAGEPLNSECQNREGEASASGQPPNGKDPRPDQLLTRRVSPMLYHDATPRNLAAKVNERDGLNFHVNTTNRAWEPPAPPVVPPMAHSSTDGPAAK